MTQLSTSSTIAPAPRTVLPNFLVVGASRSGTTTLHSYLRQHPEVYLNPDQRELHFFNRDTEYSQGLDAYAGRFQSHSGEKAVGDVTPPYFFHGITTDSQGAYRFDPEEDAPARIAQSLPSAQIFITLRNPVDRAYSQYWKARRNGRESAVSFREAIEAELAGQRNEHDSPVCWLYKNRYSVHIARWLSLYPRDRVTVVLFEEWTKNPPEFMRQFAQVMGIDSRFQPNYEAKNSGWLPRSQLAALLVAGRLKETVLGKQIRRWNRSAGYPPISCEDYHFVLETLWDDINCLEQLLDRNLKVWRESK